MSDLRDVISYSFVDHLIFEPFNNQPLIFLDDLIQVCRSLFLFSNYYNLKY